MATTWCLCFVMAVFTVLNGVQVCVTVKYSNIWKIDLLKKHLVFLTDFKQHHLESHTIPIGLYTDIFVI